MLSKCDWMHIDTADNVTVASKAAFSACPISALGLVFVLADRTLATCASFGASRAFDASLCGFVGCVWYRCWQGKHVLPFAPIESAVQIARLWWPFAVHFSQAKADVLCVPVCALRRKSSRLWRPPSARPAGPQTILEWVAIGIYGLFPCYNYGMEK